ncbi:PEP-CTERM motif protein [Posidoniimonas polymericola]|uniref:PEP-CTERM motif protein n=1 Tax=Posidoniimonas polymericola TaxID=2528002 RepID=A0A5C5YMG6_9BACT|nr:PEP-CTERM sorting domain-containing protein [Posidoniimonas polymericola]TWT76045.1 PEP-CTERM motif protein [Posidoniimonas polymericola]
MNHTSILLRRLARSVRAASLAVTFSACGYAPAVDLLYEDFEGVTLQPTVTFESELRSREAWQQVGANGPTGWTELNLTTSVGNTESGVLEFEGWRFVDKQWWIETAGDQGRSNFVSGVGTIAVADPDEWDDFGNPSGSSESDLDPLDGVFDSTLITPTVSISGVTEPVRLAFSSSWFDEDQQTATVTARYNNGAVEVLDTWTSDVADPNFKNEAFDESLTYTLHSIPAGASNVQFEFRLQGNNDWWWAVDNVRAYTGDATGADGVLRAVLDRDTGEVTITNNTGAAVQLRGYSITSEEGAFDEGAASFLSATDSSWVQATQVGGQINDLSEVHLSAATLAAGETIDFGSDVWLRYFEESGDVAFHYLIDGSDDQIEGVVEFVGNGGASFEFLDLNFDGAVDIGDWSEFIAITDTANLSDLPTAQAYLKGDLNDDGRLNAADFATFRRAFDAAVGAGAFSAMLSSAAVPEPATAAVLAVAGVGLLLRRKPRVAPGLIAALALILLAVPAQQAQAQRLSDGVGVTEWEEWAFADREWWSDVAGDQQRSQFTLGSGVVAIADPDEWDDIGGPGGATTLNTQLRSPAINISGVGANSLTLSFASSWRDEDTQGASLDVFYDGVATEVFQWSSDPLSANFKDDAPNEMVTITLPDSGGASTMQLGFNMFNATNDWWWAIDNISVSGNTGSLFTEDFESVVLGDPIDENNPPAEGPVYSQDGPAGWVINTDNYNPPVTPFRERHVETITRFIPPPPPATLELQVNTTTGMATLVSVSDEPVVLTGYSVSSESGDLSPTEWASTNLDARGVDQSGPGAGEAWETVVANGGIVFEAFFDGQTTIAPGESLEIGRLFATPGGIEDLLLTYAFIQEDQFGQVLDQSSDVAFSPVVVSYFSVALPGDFNGNGVVDAADYTVWRASVGTANDLAGNGNEAGGSAGVVDNADYALWKANYGATVSSAASAGQAPEPAAAVLGLLGVLALAVRRRPSIAVVVLVAAAVGGGADHAFAQADGPAPFVDRDYGFGDVDPGATVGQVMSNTDSNGNVVTYDNAGQTGANQLIDLVAKGRFNFYPKYVDTTDRPDGQGGIGIALNQQTFERQYLRTGFSEALNNPEQSPSSVATLTSLEYGPGTLNYFRVSDRGFQLWTKPTDVAAGEQHIVMDTQQHGVLINSDGKFAMRYASEFDIEITIDPGLDGVEGTEDDELITGEPMITPADYETDISPVDNQWYHLAVVRPRGPGNGSILYVNGVAEAVGFGAYAIETVVNIGEGDNFTNIAAVDQSPLYIGARTDADSLDRNLNSSTPDDDRYYHGVVDDLEMFVMGLNDNDNIGGGGDNVLNDWGEWYLPRDNQYAQAFAPAVDGDLNGDNLVTLADANLFASNWLAEKTISSVDPFDGFVTSRRIGDLETRALGDFNYDGLVDLNDWAVLNNANPAAGVAAMRLITGAVPEPNSSLLVLAIAGCCGSRCRGRIKKDAQ